MWGCGGTLPSRSLLAGWGDRCLTTNRRNKYDKGPQGKEDAGKVAIRSGVQKWLHAGGAMESDI